MSNVSFSRVSVEQVPVRSNWLNQFVAEAYDETVAIRGSRYRGQFGFINLWIRNHVISHHKSILMHPRLSHVLS